MARTIRMTETKDFRTMRLNKRTSCPALGISHLFAQDPLRTDLGEDTCAKPITSTDNTVRVLPSCHRGCFREVLPASAPTRDNRRLPDNRLFAPLLVTPIPIAERCFAPG